MKQYTIELTTAEDLALSYVAVSQKEWLDNLAHNRCRIAIDEIISIALEKSIENNIPLPTNKEEIVIFAFKQEWVKPALDMQTNFNEPKI